MQLIAGYAQPHLRYNDIGRRVLLFSTSPRREIKRNVLSLDEIES